MILDDEGLGSLMGLDERMEQFILQVVNSFPKWDIVQFFYDHPDKAIKPVEVAKALNRPAEQVKRDIQELLENGVLTGGKSGKQLVFRYAPEGTAAGGQELKAKVEQFVSLCKTREGRLRVIYKILKNGKPISG